MNRRVEIAERQGAVAGIEVHWRQAGDAPVLIRIDTKSGHGASSTTKTIEQTADIYSFLFQNLGVTPKFNP
jgi:protease II